MIASAQKTASAPQIFSDKKKMQRTKCEIWTRVMGYHRAVSYFNIGKKSEFSARQNFSEIATANSKFCANF